MGGCFLIQITPQLRILVAVEPIDGRKGMDSIAQLCRPRTMIHFSGSLMNKFGESNPKKPNVSVGLICYPRYFTVRPIVVNDGTW